jgi:hypothetical protein
MLNPLFGCLLRISLGGLALRLQVGASRTERQEYRSEHQALRQQINCERAGFLSVL